MNRKFKKTAFILNFFYMLFLINFFLYINVIISFKNLTDL